MTAILELTLFDAEGSSGRTAAISPIQIESMQLAERKYADRGYTTVVLITMCSGEKFTVTGGRATLEQILATIRRNA